MISRTSIHKALVATVWSALCGAALFVGAGCTAVGYRVGSTLPPGIEVVHVPTFLNRTSQPQLELDTTQATIAELQRDGTLMIGDVEKADVVLKVELIDFFMEPLRYESDSNTTTREYRMTIKATVELTNRRTKAVMVKTIVKGENDFIPIGDLSSGKREALPKASRDLAHQIVKAVVEFW
jgi:hypothetical protein